MGEISVYKSLFKKLSALRATLTDEEQALLDRLVIGEHKGLSHEAHQDAPGPPSITRAAGEGEAVSHQMNMAKSGNVTIRVSYDPLKELYLVD